MRFAGRGAEQGLKLAQKLINGAHRSAARRQRTVSLAARVVLELLLGVAFPEIGCVFGPRIFGRRILGATDGARALRVEDELLIGPQHQPYEWDRLESLQLG